MFKRLFGNPSSSSASSGRPSSSSFTKGGSGGSGSTTSGRAAFDAVDKLKDVRLLKSVCSGGFDFVRSFVRSRVQWCLSLRRFAREDASFDDAKNARSCIAALERRSLLFFFRIDLQQHFVVNSPSFLSLTYHHRTKHDDAGDDYKNTKTLEMLEKREALLIKKISAELEKAKAFNRSGNKRAALQCLKRKKLYESQCEVVANQQLKLQEQMIVLEGSKATAETFNALKSGAGAMKQLAKETDVDKVDKVMDEISDQTEKMRQVNEALGQQVGYAAELDEDELEAELAELDALDVEDALLQKEIEELEPGFTTQSKEEVVVMPDVPKMKPVPKMPANVKKIASTEEEELEALRVEMELLG